jgi:abnormal spindle-like microcephaly-associated protein
VEAVLAAGAAKRPPPLAALRELAHCTACSRACCAMALESGGVAALLGVLRSHGRDKLQAEQLGAALGALRNVAKYHGEELYRCCTAEGGLVAMAELLQHQRERQDVFMAGVALLGGLAADPGRSQALGRCPEVLSRLEGVARLLAHKRSAAATYLAKLEGQKGSDVSARQATRALVGVRGQLEALAAVLGATGASDVEALLGAPASARAGTLQGKNMIVRTALAELTNAGK